MRAPAFWWRGRGLTASLLAPLGWAGGAVAASRMRREGARVGPPVICVGNFVVGGAGKTPTAVWVAQRLAAAGERPFLVSRGYGGRLAGPLRVDPEVHTAADVGDEPLLLARAAPTVIARDRVAGAALAAAMGASVVVLDDGLQNPSLAKDFAVVVVDGARGAGNGSCVPAGPLRAPLDVQFEATDAVLVIGRGAAGDALARRAEAAGKPVFRGELRPDPWMAKSLEGRQVLAVAGLGRPEKLTDTLRWLGADVVGLHALGDHALPSERRAAVILAEAEKAGALIVTTEKDLMKWRDRRVALFAQAMALPVTLCVDDEKGLLAQLLPVARASASPGPA